MFSIFTLTLSRFFSSFLGSKCYRKNPAHFTEFSHVDSTTSSTTSSLPVCPFGATCYRKNLMHFAEYSHPFDLLNPDADDSDEDEEKKRKTTSPPVVAKKEEDDGDKTEEYDSDDVSELISR